MESPGSGSPGLRRGLAALGLVLLVVVTVFLIDSPLADEAVRWRNPALDTVVGAINPIGSGVTLLIACMTLAMLCRAFGRSRLHDAAWLAALAFTVAGLLQFSVKHLVGRPRPDAELTGIVGPSLMHDVDSFPSGHATSVFAVATVFASFYPRLRWPLYALATAIAVGRVYLDRHYVSDVVAGAVIGTVIATYALRHRETLLRPIRVSPAAETAGAARLRPPAAVSACGPPEHADPPGRAVQLDAIAVPQTTHRLGDVDDGR